MANLNPTNTNVLKLTAVVNTTKNVSGSISAPSHLSGFGAPTASTKDGYHNLLTNRDMPDQHPISAITDLQDILDTKIDDAAHVVPFTYEDDISERCNPALIINLFDGKPNWTKLYAAITRLAPKQKARIELHFFDGLTFVEIAKQENVSVQAVQQSVERSLATMKKFLEAENFDPYDDPIWD